MSVEGLDKIKKMDENKKVEIGGLDMCRPVDNSFDENSASGENEQPFEPRKISADGSGSGMTQEITGLNMCRPVTADINADNAADFSEDVLYGDVLSGGGAVNITGLDSIKHISEAVSSVRTVLPGRPYFIPETQNKKDPLEVGDSSDFMSTIRSFSGSVIKSIYSSYTGLSPVQASELCFRAGIEPNMLFRCSKVDDIVLLPICRHTPGDTLLGIRQSVNWFPSASRHRARTASARQSSNTSKRSSSCWPSSPLSIYAVARGICTGSALATCPFRLR